MRPALFTLACLLVALPLAALAPEGKQRIERLVLQFEYPASASAVPLDTAALEQEVGAAFADAGVSLVAAAGADPTTTYHLNLHVETIQSHDNLYLYIIYGRCSRLADAALKENERGKPQRIWFSTPLLAGQKGEAGFQGKVAKALHRTLQNLFNLPAPAPLPVAATAPPASSQPGLTVAPSQDPVDFAFHQIRVRKQPVAPAYPPAAKSRGVQGNVVVSILVDILGFPYQVEALSGPPELLMTAVRYALEWEFEPAMLNGHAVPSRFTLTMPFRLRFR